MPSHVVTALGGGIAHPVIVATERVQRDTLVDLALRDPGYVGVSARQHGNATFYVADRPLCTPDDKAPRRWMQVGFFARFGGVLFVDETTPTGDDWSWVALRPRPLADVPVVHFDQPTQTQFPSAAVMPIDEVRKIVLEWCDTGERPTSVQWLTVNDLRWKLTSAGEIANVPA